MTSTKPSGPGPPRKSYHMASAELVARTLARHPDCNLHLIATAPFERYRPSTTRRSDVQRSGGHMCCSPSRTAAATRPKWGFPLDNGIWCDLVVQLVCIGF